MPDTVLFELTQLASYIQSDVDTASATLARDLATGLIQSETGQHLFRATTTAELEPDPFQRHLLRLPQTPIVSVGTVVDDDGNTLTGWERHGQLLTRVSGWHCHVTVTYTHGFDTIPATIRAVALACAARVMVNPGGVRQVAVGDVSTSYAGSDADTVSGAFLTDRERAMLRRALGARPLMVPVR